MKNKTLNFIEWLLSKGYFWLLVMLIAAFFSLKWGLGGIVDCVKIIQEERSKPDTTIIIKNGKPDTIITIKKINK